MRAAGILVAAVMLSGIAQAQQPTTPTEPPLTPSASAQAIIARACSRLEVGREITETELQFIRACQEALQTQQENLKLEIETAKLAAETEAIKNANSDRIWSLLMSFGPLIGAILGVFPVVLGLMAKNGADRRLLRLQSANERAARREQHTMELLRQLADDDSSRRSFAAAGLIAMVREDFSDKGHMPRSRKKERLEDGTEETERREATAMLSTLLARLRGDKLEHFEAKFIADELAKLIALQAGYDDSLKFSDFNMQQINVANAYWKGVDARDVDFYRSNLSGVSFRDADLRGAVFYECDLTGAVFSGAKLQGANFSGANMSGVRGLDSAVFDQTTRWPEGFAPPERTG
jgi:hypothetical protein